jgi:hypothetical protein
MVMGSLGPWGTVFGISVAGTKGDGVYTLAFGVMAAVALWRAWATGGSRMLTSCAALAGGVLAVGLYDYQRIARGPDPDEFTTGNELSDAFAEGIASTVAVGWGLYVLILGAAATLAASLVAWRLQTSTGRQSGPPHP